MAQNGFHLIFHPFVPRYFHARWFVMFFCAQFWFLQLLAFLSCTLLAAPEPFLWLAVYRWKCQNHQRPQRSQRFQNFLRHRRESGRERGGGPWWIFVACWPLWRKGLYRFEGLANVSWMWIDSIVLVRVQSFGCPNVVTHMSTQRQRKHEVLVFAFWVVGCSALNKHGSAWQADTRSPLIVEAIWGFLRCGYPQII